VCRASGVCSISPGNDCQLNSPDSLTRTLGVLAFTIADPGNGEEYNAILNMEDSPLSFDLPELENGTEQQTLSFNDLLLYPC
jgi:hypothetical protein